MRHRSAGLFAVAMLVLSGVGVAHAQTGSEARVETDPDDQARALYQAGAVQFDAGDYESALSLFERAYELSARPELLFNIGTTADRLRRNEDAIEAFERFIEERPDAPQALGVRTRLEVMRSERERERGLHDAALTGEEAQRKRRRGIIIGVVIGATALIAAGIVTGVLLSRDGPQEPEHDFRLNTLRFGP